VNIIKIILVKSLLIDITIKAIVLRNTHLMLHMRLSKLPQSTISDVSDLKTAR